MISTYKSLLLRTYFGINSKNTITLTKTKIFVLKVLFCAKFSRSHALTKNKSVTPQHNLVDYAISAVTVDHDGSRMAIRSVAGVWLS